MLTLAFLSCACVPAAVLAMLVLTFVSCVRVPVPVLARVDCVVMKQPAGIATTVEDDDLLDLHIRWRFTYPMTRNPRTRLRSYSAWRARASGRQRGDDGGAMATPHEDNDKRLCTVLHSFFAPQIRACAECKSAQSMPASALPAFARAKPEKWLVFLGMARSTAGTSWIKEEAQEEADALAHVCATVKGSVRVGDPPLAGRHISAQPVCVFTSWVLPENKGVVSPQNSSCETQVPADDAAVGDRYFNGRSAAVNMCATYAASIAFGKMAGVADR